MDEVPPLVTSERTMRAAALPIRMNAHSRRSICFLLGFCNQQTQLKALVRRTPTKLGTSGLSVNNWHDLEA
jgi:hypothetical protein